MAAGHGGSRPYSGRKKKHIPDDIKQQMDAALSFTDFIAVWAKMVRSGDQAMIKLWSSYRLGIPAQQVNVDQDSTVTVKVIRQNAQRDS